MSVNSSFYFNAAPPPSPFFSLPVFVHTCMNSTLGIISIAAFAIITILVLPLYIFVLYLGHQRWQQQRSNMTMSHCDLFTYHGVVLELISVLGFALSCCGAYTDQLQITIAGVYLFCFNITGQNFFQVLTCVERYLAVVHPVTYRSLKKAKWIRIRNITVGCVWLVSIASLGFIASIVQIRIVCVCLLAFVLIIVPFCSLSVLCVLIRPGPGDRGGARQQIDQSKLRPFYTIMAILGVLLVRFGNNMFISFLYVTTQQDVRCGIWMSSYWFFLPSSLVLPLLFLQRAGKLPCCKNNNT